MSPCQGDALSLSSPLSSPLSSLLESPVDLPVQAEVWPSSSCLALPRTVSKTVCLTL